MLGARPRLAEPSAERVVPVLCSVFRAEDRSSVAVTSLMLGKRVEPPFANENTRVHTRQRAKKVFLWNSPSIPPAVSRSHKTVHFGTKRVCRKKSNVDLKSLQTTG